VQQAREEIRQALPFALRGIDSDNGWEFIHDHLLRYCRSRAIQFTRGRPSKKDDNAPIEQKNWTHLRRILGYLRDDTVAAREAIDDLYRNELRLFQNLFLPSVKLERKERVGSRLIRHYEAPQTPFQRVAASPVADPERVTELRRQRETFDPFELSAAIQAKLERIFSLRREAPASSLPDAKGGRRRHSAPRPRGARRSESRRIGGQSSTGRVDLRVGRHLGTAQPVPAGIRSG
jgi:hypothetical protein